MIPPDGPGFTDRLICALSGEKQFRRGVFGECVDGRHHGHVTRSSNIVFAIAGVDTEEQNAGGFKLRANVAELRRTIIVGQNL